MALSVNPGSSDCVPVYYPVASQVTYIVPGTTKYGPAGTIPFYQTVTVQAPTYANLDLRGNSQVYAGHVANYGTVNATVFKSNINSRYAPAYVEVVVDSFTYVIKVGVEVTIPTNVYDVINLTSNIAASITG